MIMTFTVVSPDGTLHTSEETEVKDWTLIHKGALAHAHEVYREINQPVRIKSMQRTDI